MLLTLFLVGDIVIFVAALMNKKQRKRSSGADSRLLHLDK